MFYVANKIRFHIKTRLLSFAGNFEGSKAHLSLRGHSDSLEEVPIKQLLPLSHAHLYPTASLTHWTELAPGQWLREK